MKKSIHIEPITKNVSSATNKKPAKSALKSRKPLGELAKSVTAATETCLNKVDNIVNALQDVRENLHSLCEAIADFLIIIDHNGTIMQTNSPCMRRLGYSVKELLGRNVTELYPIELRSEASKSINETIKNNTATILLPLVCKSANSLSKG